MIIFDLDGTLADCEHRRHFVDPSYRDDCYYHFPATLKQSKGWYYKNVFLTGKPPKPKKFVPDWKAFYEVCNKDKPINPVIHTFHDLYFNSPGCRYFYENVQIWSGRCESVREKTYSWLRRYVLTGSLEQNLVIKMRPLGDYTPDDQLKERWLDEALANGKTIEYVFDDRPKVINMWHRRGIFVFNCNQSGEEF